MMGQEIAAANGAMVLSAGEHAQPKNAQPKKKRGATGCSALLVGW